MVPEQHQFAELEQALAPRERASLTPRLEELLLRFDAHGEIAEPALEAFLTACNAAREEDAAAVRQLQAWRWLERQRGVDEAFRSMGRSWRRRASGTYCHYPSRRQHIAQALRGPTAEEVMAVADPAQLRQWRQAGELERRIAERQSPEYRASDLRMMLQLERDRIAPEQSSRRTLPAAYSRYFHRDHPAQLRTTLAHWDQVNAALAVAEHHLAALMRQCDEPGSARSAEIALGLIRRRHTLSVRRAMETLHGYSPVIRRNDSMARERLLAYHLWSGLAKTAGRPGASALAHLLSVDGVDHSLDQRTLERLISGWSASRITPAQNPPAH